MESSLERKKKQYCQELLKTHSEELADKEWTVIFAPDLIEYVSVGVSLSDAKFMGEEYSNESCNKIY